MLPSFRELHVIDVQADIVTYTGTLINEQTPFYPVFDFLPGEGSFKLSYIIYDVLHFTNTDTHVTCVIKEILTDMVTHLKAAK